jgi:rod shape-determining protein MreB and related proteins
LTRDIAIDLGTSTTLAAVEGRNVVVNEPTVIAMERATARVVAVGRESWKAAAADPERVSVSWPFRMAPVSDFAVTERIIASILKRASSPRITKPRALFTVPSAATEVERRALEEAAFAAGVRDVWMIGEPLAAALGAELPIAEPRGSCIVDVGGAATEVAVISMSGIVAQRHVRIGGFDMDDLIQRFLRREYGMAVGERTAEGIKTQVGSASPMEEEVKAEVRGREINTGAPKAIVITSEEVRAALEDAVRIIVEAVRGVLSDTPPELAHDVLDDGITLCGGGAQLQGLGERIRSETSIPARVVEAPGEVVVLGALKAISALDEMAAAGIVARRSS